MKAVHQVPERDVRVLHRKFSEPYASRHVEKHRQHCQKEEEGREEGAERREKGGGRREAEEEKTKKLTVDQLPFPSFGTAAPP